jgi:hypothetical protein
VEAKECDSSALNTWQQTALADSRLSLLFGGCLPNLRPAPEPDEYFRARIHTSQINLRTSLFVLAAAIWNFLVVLGYWLTPQ